MGATVTTAKLAGAFKAPNNETVFVLWEQTFEKNCYPHTPRWSCVFIGRLADAMKQIFLFASGCEGGTTQGRNGWITPEGYIAGWLKELANPVEVADVSMRLLQGSGLYDAVNKDNRDAVIASCDGAGRTDIADALRTGGEPTLSLHADAALVLALVEAGILPWRLIRSLAPTYGFRNPALGYAPEPVRPSVDTLPAFRKLDDDTRLVQRDDGAWICVGWEYSIVQHFIRDLAAVELREPGTYRKRIKAFREALRAAPTVSAARVVVDQSIPLESEYQRSAVAELRGKVEAEATANGYSFAYPVDDSLNWAVLHLPAACTTWVLPEEGETAPIRGEQLSLLVA